MHHQPLAVLRGSSKQPDVSFQGFCQRFKGERSYLGRLTLVLITSSDLLPLPSVLHYRRYLDLFGGPVCY